MFTIKDKDNYWMFSWLDQFMIGHKGFICGGCFKNIFCQENVKDLDIFFHNKKDFEEAVEWYDSKTAGYSEDYLHKLSEEDAEYKFLYENKNVKAYIHKRTNVRIELCNKIFGAPEDVLSQFDFTITKFAYYKEEVENEGTFDSPGGSTHIEYKVLVHNDFFEHLHTKRLVIDDKIPYPMSTFERILKYAKYGFSLVRKQS